jgi:hypothetical protein
LYITRKQRFGIHIDEATDCIGIGPLVAYVQYVEDTTVSEDMLSAQL